MRLLVVLLVVACLFSCEKGAIVHPPMPVKDDTLRFKNLTELQDYCAYNYIPSGIEFYVGNEKWHFGISY